MTASSATNAKFSSSCGMATATRGIRCSCTSASATAKCKRRAMSEQQPTSVNWALLSLFRRGLSREQAANYVGVGPTKFDKMVRDGRMPRPKRVDGRVVWDLRKLDALEDDDPDKPETNP